MNRKSNWDIHFENLSSITTTGSAKVLSQPSLDGTTSIEDYSVSTTSPGDSISFTFKVVNDGNYNAQIQSINIGTPNCTGTDTTSNTNVCSKLSYTLTDLNGASIAVGDMLYAKDSVTMKVTLTYAEFNDPSLLATEDVTIGNLGITINYIQSGSALVKDNGEVANNKVYHQGDKLSLNNEDYYVIADSGAGQDYVVALKENALTLAEVNYYSSGLSVTITNRNGYGAINNSGQYDESNIKLITNAWALDKFQNNELKVVDEYKARLMTKDEYDNINGFSWRYSNKYWFWLMTFSSNQNALWRVSEWGEAYVTYVSDCVIRPVINVSKSALETNISE